MVTRHILTVNDELHSQLLTCYPAENQAAKIFVEWLKNHPEYNPEDVDIRIDSYEREEDHYGNGGGYDRYVRIYKSREETPDEHVTRVKREENEKFNDFSRNVRRCVSDLIRELNIYPNVVSQEITEKTNEIVNSIEDVTRKCLIQKMK